MLIHIDPTLLLRPDWDALKHFLRKPFSAESCQRVDARLPRLARVYRAMAERWAESTGWAGALPTSQVDSAVSVFAQVRAVGARPLPLMPETILKAQVILLEEVLSDDAAWIRKRAALKGGDAPAAPPARLDARASRLALHAIALHEAAFLALTGLYDVRCERSLIEFSLTPRGIESLRNRVVTAPMDCVPRSGVREVILKGPGPRSVKSRRRAVRVDCRPFHSQGQ